MKLEELKAKKFIDRDNDIGFIVAKRKENDQFIYIYYSTHTKETKITLLSEYDIDRLKGELTDKAPEFTYKKALGLFKERYVGNLDLYTIYKENHNKETTKDGMIYCEYNERWVLLF